MPTHLYLASKSVPVGDSDVVIHELSGLDRFDFQEYTATLAQPEKNDIATPDENASPQEWAQYERASRLLLVDWNRFNFLCQSRLVAYGVRQPDESIDSKHQWVMKAFSSENVTLLHNQIAELSSMILPDKDDGATAAPDEQSGEEATDPKA